MTDPHPDAVGSLYGEFHRWAVERSGMHPKRTTDQRWWQQLVSYRALEVDADGRLCWDTVVLSTPRQSGKSWLLRELCMWRLSLADRFGESQTVLHTAMQLKHVTAVWRPAARWAQAAGYRVRFANGEQQIEDQGSGSLWLLQAANDGLGVSLSVSLGVVDEAWGVGRELIDNSLAPTLAESEQPQLWLISTAGVPSKGERVTDLMPGYRALGLVREQSRVLFVEWSAPGEPSDPGVWRAAAAHWDERRFRTVEGAWAKASTPRAVAAFQRQWLNQWDARERVDVPPLLPGWEGLRVAGLPGVSAVAVESEPGGRPLVASAGLLPDGRVCVGVREAPSMGVAVDWCRGAGVAPLVGKSLLHDPGWADVGAVPMTGTSAAACAQLLQLVADGVLVHDGGGVLSGQVAGLVEVSSVAGRAIRGTGGTAAIKAAVWAAGAARSSAAAGPPMIW
jgi:hypothetical protein